MSEEFRYRCRLVWRSAMALVLSLLMLLGLCRVVAASYAGRMDGAAYVPVSDALTLSSARVLDRRDNVPLIQTTNLLTTYAYLPLVMGSRPCSVPGATYETLTVVGEPTDRPAEAHADLNLELRGYEPVDAYRGLVDYNGGSDPKAPQLAGLFANTRVPDISAVYQVHQWDWGCNCRGPVITDPEVTLAGLVVTPGETIHVPPSGYFISSEYQVLVLYADSDRITLKYTREDNVVHGYTIHVEGICVEPSLLALYQAWNEAGRGELPALGAAQAFGRARASEVGVAIRDTGAFLDPRSRKDWWQGN